MTQKKKKATTKILPKRVSQQKGIQASSVRPPVVVVLGHVDHGKTSLLDKIRKTNLASKEAGGITQHIGAFQVEVNQKDGQKKITFIDTPGHAAFGKMRSRGAQVADLAVLVVAANEGIKEQTKESLKYIKAAKLDFLVALNKIDLPNIYLDNVKKGLAEAGIEIEEYGGQVVTIPVSAKTGAGLNDLLEMILLLAQMKGLTSDSKKELKAVVIESRLDQRCGNLATILVREGSLNLGDEVEIGGTVSKIKALFDENKKSLKQVLPGQAAEVLGFNQLPLVGAEVLKKGSQKGQKTIGSVCQLLSDEEERAKDACFRAILKADTLGTLEAISAQLPTNCALLKKEVGEICESDIFQAAACNLEVIGFNVKLRPAIKKLAEEEGVKVSTHKTIYELVESIEKRIEKILDPEPEQEILGRAQILAEFVINKSDRVAGGKVTEGVINRANRVIVERESEQIKGARIASLKTGKEVVDRVETDQEFGLQFTKEIDFKVGDVILSVK